MNKFNEIQLANDSEGLLESCDFCNRLIINWETLTNCWVTFDNRISCRKCLTDIKSGDRM
jgi:hypothetical protein